MRRVDSRFVRFIILALVIGCLATACGPTTATVKVTLKDQDGAVLAGFTVAIGDKSAKTDAAGVATVKEVPPGQVTIKLSREGVTDQHIETVAKGDNAFSYSVNMHVFTFVPLGELAKMRIKISPPGKPPMFEAIFVPGQGSHWFMGGGANQVIVMGDKFYVKQGDEPWILVPTDEMTGSGMSAGAFIASFAQVWVDSLETFDQELSREGVTSVFKGTGTANGYSCDLFEVTVPDGEGGPVRFYVINQGEFKGLITRYEDVTPTEHSAVIDIVDFGAELTVKAPL